MKPFRFLSASCCSHRVWATLIATAVCALGLQACGGGGGGDAPAAPAPNPGGSPGTADPTPTPPTEPPLVQYSPTNLTVTVRQPAFFSVGGGPGTYQWQRNGVDIPGATQYFHTFVAQAADAGARYRAVLRNAAGSATSESAQLTVLDAPTGALSLVAGEIGGRGNLDGVGAAARFQGPFGLAVDASGALLVADVGLRRVTADGTVRRVDAFNEMESVVSVAADSAGTTYVATSGRFPAISRIAPNGSNVRLADLRYGGAIRIALDRAGHLIVANGTRLERLRTDPVPGQQPVAPGAGELLFDASDLPGPFGGFCDLAVDDSGNILFTTNSENTVRSLGLDGKLTTQVSAGLLRPCGLAFDPSGALLIADTGNRVIRKVLPGGALGAVGPIGSQDSPSARFTQPTTLATSPGGTVYVGDNHTVRRIDTNGNVTTLAGLAGPTGPGFGAYHATDAAGNVYVAQPAQFTPGSPYLLQKITPAGDATALAGLTDPRGIAVDGAGNVYIADAVNRCAGNVAFKDCSYALLLKFDAAQGRLGVLAGAASPPPAGGGADVDGAGTAARFSYGTYGVAVDAAGNVFVGQTGRVRKVTPDGTVSTLTDKIGGEGVAVDHSTGDVYTTVCSNPQVDVLIALVSRIDPAGNVTSLTRGTNYRPDRQDQLVNRTNACAKGLAIDSASNLFVAYPSLHVVGKFAPDGGVTTVVGRTDLSGIAPGPLPATLLGPTDLSFDGAGNLIIGSAQAILKVRFNK